jgi:16S rRNA (cytosine967-C5)-methyltransferase
MKAYPNLIEGVIEVLVQTFGKHIYADKVIPHILKENKKWGSRDRKFVANHSYEIIRNWRLLWHILGQEPSMKRKHLMELFDAYWNWLETGSKIPEGLPLGVVESYAAWFDERASNELGDHWPALAHALNQPASVVLRNNVLRQDRKSLVEILTKEGIDCEVSDVADESVVLANRPKLMHLKSYQKGRFEIQDGGSQLIVQHLDLQPGERFFDACCGAGGKAIQAASIMGNQGEILAMDTNDKALSECRRRAKRNGVDIITTESIKRPASVLVHQEWADKLLLDVPCSGSGVIRRDVDSKWKLQPEHLDKTIQIQKDILHKYHSTLKPGGTMVYATCSILRSENEDQVASFMEAFGEDFTLVDEFRLSPEHPHSDGYFIAIFQKHDD